MRIRSFPFLPMSMICMFFLYAAMPAYGQSDIVNPSTGYSAVDRLSDYAPEAFGSSGDNLALFEKSTGLQIVSPADGTIMMSLGKPTDYFDAYTLGSVVNVWSSFVAADPGGNSFWVGFNNYGNTDDRIYQVDQEGHWTQKAMLIGNWDMEFHGSIAYLSADTSGMGGGNNSVWRFNTSTSQLVDIAHVGGYSAGLGVDSAGNIYYGTYGFTPGNQSLYRFSAQQISGAVSSGTPLELESAAKLADFVDAYGPYDLDVDAADNVVFNLNGSSSKIAVWNGIQGNGANYNVIGNGEGDHWYTMLATIGNIRQPGGSVYAQDYFSPGIAQLTRLANPWGGGSLVDNHWTTPENWALNAAPVAGDALYFSGTTRLPAQNDFTAGAPFHGITFTALAGAFILSGNKITLVGDVINQSANVQTINLDLDLSGGDRTFDTQNSDIIINGAIGEAETGCGIIKKGAGVLTLANSADYSGDTIIEDGLLQLNGAVSDLHTISGKGDLGVGDGVDPATLTADSIKVNTLTIAAGAKIVISPRNNIGPMAGKVNLTSVPEPNSIILLAMAALGLFIWKKRHSVAHS